MNDDTPTQPPASRKKPILAIVLGFIALIIIILLGVLLWPDSKEPKTEQQPIQFQNWLKPASEIKVGANRYVSPCSVMPPHTANDLLGPLGGQTVIQETYADQSVGNSISAPKYRCSYNAGLGDGPKLVLEAQESTNANGPPNIKFAILASEQEIQGEIDLYQKAITNTGTDNADITSLVQNFKQSLTYFKQASFTSKAEGLPSNFILPISDSIQGVSNDFSYTWVYKNTFYTLGHSPNIIDSKGKQTAYSDQQIVDELGKISKAYKAAQANIANASLDQSPAPTIIGGNTDKYGSTTILESCAVLSPDVYAKITGKPQTEAVDRTTVSYDFTAKYYTKRDNQLILPANKCARQINNDTTNENTYANLQIEYGSSAEQAQEWLNKNFKVDSRDTKLTTDADWAVSFVNPVTPEKYDPVVMFRVGSYIGTVKIYTSGASEVEFTAEQYTAAINELVTSLKQNVANIE